MDVERWQRVQDLLRRAIALPPGERDAFVRTACAEVELAEEVLAIVAEDADDAGLLDGGIAAAAHQMMSGDAASPPVASIGPYQLEDLLGEGGMGVVFRARRADLGSVVAIKFLKDAALSRARRDRFFREQQLLAQLNHPAIARLYDAGVLPDRTPYFIMEYVEGVPITVYCRDRRSAIAERLRLFRQACEPVQYAHRQLVVHRDIKPSNVMVTVGGQVKLLDFGISKRMDAPALDVTRSGVPLMTPAYAAPEQLRGESPSVDSDVYALGLVLYELLTGRLPFDAADSPSHEAVMRRLEHDPERPSTGGGRALARALGDPISGARWGDLDVLTLTAIQRDRARRYSGVEALIRDLDRYPKNEPLEARPDGWRYRARKYVERNRRWLSAAAAGVALVTSLVSVYTVRLRRARDAAEREVQRTQRIERFMFDLFDNGDHSAGVDKSLLALTLVERGVRSADTMNADPQVQADLYGGLGNIYRRLGDMGKADKLLQAALSKRLALFGDDAPETARSELDLALLRNEQAQLDAAEELARRALAGANRQRAVDPLGVARASDALGRILQARGRYDQAIVLLDESVRLFTDAAPDTAELSAGLAHLSNTHFYLGHYDVSWTLMQRTLELDIKLHGDRHPTVSSDLFDLGAIRAELGYYADAMPYYWKGLAITKEWYGEDNNQTAADLIVVARGLDKLGRRKEALDFARRALAIRERVLGDSHPMVASVLNEIGRMTRDAGRFDEAERLFRRMLAIYEKTYPKEDHYLVGLAHANLGSVFLAQQQWAEAEPKFAKALAVYAGTLPATHPNVGIARVKHGRALLGEKRYREAIDDSLAGYDILTKQTNPNLEWLTMAREDLAKEYRAQGRPEQAEKYLAELRDVPRKAR